MSLTIPYFTSIPFQSSHLLSLCIVFGIDGYSHDISPLLAQFLEVIPPYLLPILFREVRIVERDVYARNESVVKGPDTVGREK